MRRPCMATCVKAFLVFVYAMKIFPIKLTSRSETLRIERGLFEIIFLKAPYPQARVPSFREGSVRVFKDLPLMKRFQVGLVDLMSGVPPVILIAIGIAE